MSLPSHPSHQQGEDPSGGGVGGGDDLSLVSGFYGPGALACWYLLIASVAAVWAWDWDRRFTVSGELVAVLVYPVLASGDLVVKSALFPADQSASLCDTLASLLDTLTGAGRSSSSPYDARVYAVHAPLRVVDVFHWVCVAGLFAIWCYGDTRKQARRMRRLLRVGVLWTWVAMVALQVKTFTAGGFAGQGLGLIIFGLLQWMIFVVMLPMLAYCGSMVGLLFVNLRAVLYRVVAFVVRLAKLQIGGPLAIDLLIFLGIGLASWTGSMLLLAVRIGFPYRLFLPMSSSTIDEFDQAAALIAGLASASYTLYTLKRRGYVPEQTLPLHYFYIN